MMDSDKTEGRELFERLVALLRRPSGENEETNVSIAETRPELDAFLKAHPHSVPALRLMAEVEERQGNRQQARALIHRAEIEDPWNPEILIIGETLAEAEAASNPHSNPVAAPWLDSKISSTVISPDDLAEKALGAYKLGDLERSYSLSKLAYLLAPKQGHHLLDAWTAGAALDPARTHRELRLLEPEASEEPFLYLALGSIDNVLGRYEEAGYWLDKGLHLQPEDPYLMAMLLNELAYVMARQEGRLDDCLGLVRKALEVFPNRSANGFIRDTLGLIYLKKGQNDKALRNLQEAVAKDPGVISRLHLTVAMLRHRDTPGAILQLQAIANSRPTLDTPHLEESQILRRIQNHLPKLEDLLNLGGIEELQEAEKILADLL